MDDSRHADEGRFTVCPVPDSHGTRRVSAEAAVSYASAARPAVARRAAQAEMGATPQSEGLVRVRTQVCFHTPAPVPWGRSRSINPYAGRRFERRFEAAGHPFADRPAVWQPGITEQSRGTPDGSGHSPSRQVRVAPSQGRTLRDGIAGPAAVVQPQRRQRHAEPLARTWKRRFRAQAPRCRCARAARHRRPPSGGQDPPPWKPARTPCREPVDRRSGARGPEQVLQLDDPYLLKDVFEGRKFEDGKPVSTQQRKNAA